MLSKYIGVTVNFVKEPFDCFWRIIWSSFTANAYRCGHGSDLCRVTGWSCWSWASDHWTPGAGGKVAGVVTLTFIDGKTQALAQNLGALYSLKLQSFVECLKWMALMDEYLENLVLYCKYTYLLGCCDQEFWVWSPVTIMGSRICQLWYRSAHTAIIRYRSADINQEFLMVQSSGLFATCLCYKYCLQQSFIIWFQFYSLFCYYYLLYIEDFLICLG